MNFSWVFAAIYENQTLLLYIYKYMITLFIAKIRFSFIDIVYYRDWRDLLIVILLLYLPLDILFSSNHNIHKSLYGLCFWASDPFIEIFL